MKEPLKPFSTPSLDTVMEHRCDERTLAQ